MSSPSLKVWIDGKLVDKNDARVSVYDHGVLYGDGVFEGIRVYSGRIFECDAHLQRLFDSARAIRLSIPYSAAELKAAMEQTFKANSFVDCYIRLVVTRGPGPLGIDPGKCPAPCVYIITDLVNIYAKELYEKGIAVIMSSVVRTHPLSLSPRIKSLNYLNNILARIEANDAGCPEAIMLNQQGNVAEATVQNVFAVKGGKVTTPPVTDGALDGVTRRVMIEICGRLSIPCTPQSIQRHDLYIADEIFLTGTGAEVMPVTRVDNRVIGSGEAGPITRRILDAFHRHIREG